MVTVREIVAYKREYQDHTNGSTAEAEAKEEETERRAASGAALWRLSGSNLDELDAEIKEYEQSGAKEKKKRAEENDKEENSRSCKKPKPGETGTIGQAEAKGKEKTGRGVAGSQAAPEGHSIAEDSSSSRSSSRRMRRTPLKQKDTLLLFEENKRKHNNNNSSSSSRRRRRRRMKG